MYNTVPKAGVVRPSYLVPRYLNVRYLLQTGGLGGKVGTYQGKYPDKRYPDTSSSSRTYLVDGFAAAQLEVPGFGELPPSQKHQGFHRRPLLKRKRQSLLSDADCRRIAGCGLRVVGCGLWDTGCSVQRYSVQRTAYSLQLIASMLLLRAYSLQQRQRAARDGEVQREENRSVSSKHQRE